MLRLVLVGGSVTSGERCFDPMLTERLGLAEGELLAGFVSIGTVVGQPPGRSHGTSADVWSSWVPVGADSTLDSP